MIEIQNVSKAYGGVPVLSGFSARWEKGERICIMGPSGGGKTTLLRLLAGLEAPDSGQISGLGQVRLLFQEDRLSEDFTPLRNLLFSVPEVSREEAVACLTALGLGDSMHRPVRTLSGGMRRRVAIARALLAKGDTLLLDEPFQGLDDETRRKAAAEVLERLKGRTLITVSHDEEDASLLSATVLRPFEK